MLWWGCFQESVAAFELNPVARKQLMPALLSAFDSAARWTSIASILLRLIGGDGFAQV